jgi:hypothetical protein
LFNDGVLGFLGNGCFGVDDALGNEAGHLARVTLGVSGFGVWRRRRLLWCRLLGRDRRQRGDESVLVDDRGRLVHVHGLDCRLRCDRFSVKLHPSLFGNERGFLLYNAISATFYDCGQRRLSGVDNVLERRRVDRRKQRRRRKRMRRFSDRGSDSSSESRVNLRNNRYLFVGSSYGGGRLRVRNTLSLQSKTKWVLIRTVCCAHKLPSARLTSHSTKLGTKFRIFWKKNMFWY